MPRKITTEIFIEESRHIHGDFYDYSKVDYQKHDKEVKIICPLHGLFLQKPVQHRNMKQGCPRCGFIKNNKNKFLSRDEFIQNSRKIHGDKYDYSLVEYKHAKQPVKIICPTHGLFKQRPNDHMLGRGCNKCGRTYKPTTEEFIKKAKKIHKSIYDYSKVNYINAKTVVTIICQKHGEFEQTPNTHLQGCGCPSCGKFSKDSGFDTSKNAILYEIYDPQEGLYKIGITNRTVKERFKDIFNSRKLEIIDQISFANGSLALQHETTIKKLSFYYK